MARYLRSEPFFPIITLVIVLFIILGFGSSILAKGDGYVPKPVLIVHGLVTLGWFGLTLVQAVLIRGAKFTQHKTLGIASITLVLALVLLGYHTTAAAITNPYWSIAGFDNVGSAIFPFFDILTFVLVYILGIYHRKNATAHKRLMVLAGAMMMDPAVARTAIVLFGLPPLALILELAILLAFPIYDWRMRGRLHWASILGVILFAACMALRHMFGGTEAWAVFATTLF